MRILTACILSVALCGTANAVVTTDTPESQVANLLYNGCMAQRTQIGVREALRMVNPKGDPAAAQLITNGYKFGADYPSVGCNQLFTVVIDNLVKSRSKF